jgi:hypothetical protein
LTQFQELESEHNYAHNLRAEKLNDNCKDHEKSIEKLFSAQQKLADGMKDFREMLDYKTNNIEFIDIRDRFNLFADMENVKVLQQTLLPKLQRYSNEMADLVSSNQECREAVTSIDGKMVLKLNKSEITAIRYEMT